MSFDSSGALASHAPEEDVCTRDYAKKVRNVPAAVKRQIYAEYGLQHHAAGAYEVDHLISLELGGSNAITNLWPESYRTHPWNARIKDVLENHLHREACAGTITLAAAQHEIATDSKRPSLGGRTCSMRNV